MQLDKNMGDYRHFESASKNEVMDLIKEHGKPSDLEESQNDSPTVEEMLELSKKFPEITFHGYIIDKTRDDFRVSLEGFDLKNISADVVIDLLTSYSADDQDVNKNSDGSYNLYFWWD